MIEQNTDNCTDIIRRSERMLVSREKDGNCHELQGTVNKDRITNGVHPLVHGRQGKIDVVLLYILLSPNPLGHRQDPDM